MAPEPLKILRKGLEIHKKKIKDKKEQLQARLADQQSISSSDERWLDNDANWMQTQLTKNVQSSFVRSNFSFISPSSQCRTVQIYEKYYSFWLF